MAKRKCIVELFWWEKNPPLFVFVLLTFPAYVRIFAMKCGSFRFNSFIFHLNFENPFTHTHIQKDIGQLADTATKWKVWQIYHFRCIFDLKLRCLCVRTLCDRLWKWLFFFLWSPFFFSFSLFDIVRLFLFFFYAFYYKPRIN